MNEKSGRRKNVTQVKRLTLLVMSASLSSILLVACSSNEKESYTAAATESASAMATPKAGKAMTDVKGNGAAAASANPAAENKATATATANQIVIENFAFKPAKLTVAVGTKVTWVNKDSAPHTATNNDKRFNSGALDTNDQFSFVFSDKGDYPYFCALHPQMRGNITVK